ncbi:MAG TPA: hypothetical protein VE545_09490 [Candidatus Dormibacteraeota bacterium]|nr:hypothetical protein [Candidatus Dormibacteraeota bacterium]
MKLFPRYLAACFLILAGLLLHPTRARAQTDEIQVYDANIAEPGIFNLTWHNNFIADGASTPAFPGGLIPDKSFNGVTEWAYGVTNWFEAGLYLPLYSISQKRGASINGGKVRLLFVKPHAAERTFFYGVNFEFSYNALHWEATHFTSEIRPIIGWHLHPVDIIVNPILDNSFRGGFKSLDFAPAVRLVYHREKWAVGAEEYADYGPLRKILPVERQSQQLYGVFDWYGKTLNVEAGVGFGLTSASDKVTLKLILSRDLNSHGRTN